MNYATALKEGHIREGDVLTFNTDSMEWIVTRVEITDGNIIGYSIRPKTPADIPRNSWANMYPSSACRIAT